VGLVARCACGKEHQRTKRDGPCPACYMRAYRETPEGKAATKRAAKTYRGTVYG
jgi:hypothetical protein